MKRPILYILLILGLGAIALNCGRSSKNKGDDTVIIRIDGSSTVHPIIEAVAEEFTKQYQHIDLSVGVSGTGGGFKKFCREEVSIIGASRPIKPSEEAICKVSNIEFIELPVAFDGIVVVVNKRNDWVNHMTVPELHLLCKITATGTGLFVDNLGKIIKSSRIDTRSKKMHGFVRPVWSYLIPFHNGVMCGGFP